MQDQIIIQQEKRIPKPTVASVWVYHKNKFINNFLNDNLSTLQTDFDNLVSKERLYFIEKLLKYVVPIKADHTVKQPTSKYEDWTDEQIKAEIDRISTRF